MVSELEEKTGRLRQVLEAERLGGVLINAQHNFAWLTGGRSNGIDLSRDNGAAYLLVSCYGERYLIANNIEMPRLLAETVSVEDFEPIELSWQDEKASSDAVFDLARAVIPAGAQLATDVSPNSLRSIEQLITRCRYELVPAEIERLRKLGRDAGRAMGKIIADIAPGERETDIARKVRDRLSRAGIFPVVTLVGADERIERSRHPVPTENIWKQNLLIAVCARREGLIASLSRLICAGEIPAELQRRTEAAAGVNAAMYAGTMPGALASDLYKIADAAYAAQGFAGEINKHHQGGACGYRTRDWVAHPSNSETVRPNQAFAWNPTITGTKTEETGITTDTGFEVITATDGFPQITTWIEGREYSSPGVLSLAKGVAA